MYFNRQIGVVIREGSPDQIKSFIETIQWDHENALQRRHPFQLADRSCAYHAERRISQVFEDHREFFKKNILETDPGPFLRIFTLIIRKLPEVLHGPSVIGVELLTAGYRKGMFVNDADNRVRHISLLESRSWSHPREISFPPKLIIDIQNGVYNEDPSLTCFVTTGNNL